MNTRHVVHGAVALLMTGGLLAPAVSAHAGGGWVEESYEGSATCDFDGDGVYSDYETVAGQTAPTRAIFNEVDEDLVHVNVIQRLDEIEYRAAGATPEYVYFTGDVHFFGVWDLSNETDPLEGMIRVRTTVTDATGDVLTTALFVAKADDGVYEPLHLSAGPCTS